ncbi:MAG: Ribosomal RNA small subunit methyltransferase D [Syntrophus sp. SKADARSKE-3]|nr:Ribosomal RNA small subunit methyltransferase D [Syntrophus sp. SKADARSKE-3]
MRIIGGEAGGRTIASPKGLKVRPTSEMVREALFNILGSLEGTTFADIFAGTGCVGIEALSRGASKVAFVEKNPRMAHQIENVVQELGYVSRAEVLATDVKNGILRLSRANRPYDIVFADPPYERDYISKTVQYCLEGELMSKDGLMVIQHSVRELLALPSGMKAFINVLEQRRYGDTAISFIRYI